jgi:subtilase family serine protease
LRAALASASTPSYVRVGSLPQAPSGSKVVGSLAASTQMQATVFLTPQDPAALAAYATDVATPGSSVYHQYLTVPQFAQQFGATPSQVQSVESTLKAEGLKVGTVTKNDLSIPVTGTAAQLGTAFSTSFHSLALKGGRKAFANTSRPEFPASVAGYVQNVTGLDNLVLAQPEGLPAPVHSRLSAHAKVHADAVHPDTGVGTGPQPCSTISGNDKSSPGPYTADQIANAYGLTSLYAAGDEGSGQTIALYELQPYTSSDITAYESCYSITGNTPTVVKCGTCTLPPASAGNDESELDIEDVIGLAPKANVEVYEGTNGTDNITLMQGIVTDDTAKVVSTSWGACEPNWGLSNAQSENTIFEEAATQGQSIFAAAGDNGSEACGGTGSLAVGDPASQPYVTGVGGTKLTLAAPPPTESVWNEYSSTTTPPTNADTGGGISSFWTMPTYQSGAKASLKVINSSSSGTPCSASSGDCREVPDVTADADVSTGYLIYYSPYGDPVNDDGWYYFGGTSAAAPTWAAYIALVNASTGCNSTPVGFANPDLYSIASSAWNGTAYTADFNDITSGDNNPENWETSGLPYSATVGFDMTSGSGARRAPRSPPRCARPRRSGRWRCRIAAHCRRAWSLTAPTTSPTSPRAAATRSLTSRERQRRTSTAPPAPSRGCRASTSPTTSRSTPPGTCTRATSASAPRRAYAARRRQGRPRPSANRPAPPGRPTR